MEDFDVTNHLRDVYRKYGITVCRVIFHGTNYISTYVPSVDDVVAAKTMFEKNSGLILNGVTDVIFDLFERSKSYFWDDCCVSNFYSEQDRVMTALVREKKNQVINALKWRFLGRYKPKYIFAHSSSDTHEFPPGYYIIFHSERLFSKSERNGIQEKINYIVRKTLSEDYRYIDSRFRIIFSHSNSNGIYGMSRED